MILKKLKIMFYSVVLIIITPRVDLILVNTFSIEIDEISIATYIVDGDTFDIATGHRIRLADVDTPETYEVGFREASQFLSYLIYNKRIYLDIDDVYVYDIGGERLVCLVYIDFNSTHYLNVNKALLVSNHARLSNYENEFNPMTWTQFMSKLNLADQLKLLAVSLGIGIAATFVISRIIKKTWGLFSSEYYRIKRRLIKK
jgi:hypothetical protein